MTSCAPSALAFGRGSFEQGGTSEVTSERENEGRREREKERTREGENEGRRERGKESLAEAALGRSWRAIRVLEHAGIVRLSLADAVLHFEELCARNATVGVRETARVGVG
jgi:hypothetical protein